MTSISNQSGGSAHRCVSLQRRRRSARQQDRIGGAHHAYSERHRGGLPERAQPAQEPLDGDEDAEAKLYELEVNKRNAAAQVLEDSKSDVSWGHQIRSYVLDQSRIKDLRTGVEIGNTAAVLDGDLDPFLEAAPQGRSELMDDENSLIAERRAKLAKLRAGGVAFPNDFRRDALAGDLHAAYDSRDDEWLVANPTTVKVGGRMMFKRVMGKASFAKLADRTGQIQLFLQAESLGAAYEDFKGAECRRHPRGRGRTVPYQDRGAVGARDQPAHPGQVAAAAARQVAWHRRCRHALSAALRRSHHDRDQPRGVPHPRAHRAIPARFPRRPRLPRGRKRR